MARLFPGPDRGMVFQQYSLFPWKSVRDNIAFGPYVTGHGRAQSRATADDLLEMVDLAKELDDLRSGARANDDGVMRAIASKLSDADIEALSESLASQPSTNVRR
jgi:sulfonate transport system ATP-binding protein